MFLILILNSIKSVPMLSSLRGFQHTVCFLSLAHPQHRQNAFAQNYFFIVLSNLRVKSIITKMIENNIFESRYDISIY